MDIRPPHVLFGEGGELDNGKTIGVLTGLGASAWGWCLGFLANDASTLLQRAAPPSHQTTSCLCWVLIVPASTAPSVTTHVPKGIPGSGMHSNQPARVQDTQSLHKAGSSLELRLPDGQDLGAPPSAAPAEVSPRPSPTGAQTRPCRQRAQGTSHQEGLTLHRPAARPPSTLCCFCCFLHAGA